MPPTYRRCREKFMVAERKLALGKGDVRDRLRGAYKALRILHEEEIPPPLRSDWHWIMNQLTRYGPEVDRDGTPYRTAVDHTMSRIRNSTGSRIAERIYQVNRALLPSC